MEKISVIIPIYNTEKYLRKCIDSVLSQTYRNIEVILVNDGSQDHCDEIIQEYASKDSRIVTVNKSNGGLSDARNAGIDIASGDYLMFVDSDDYIALNMAEVLYRRMQEDGSDFVMCNVVYGKSDSSGEMTTIRAGLFTQSEFISSWMHDEMSYLVPVAGNKLYKRKLYDKIRYPYGKLHEDEFVIHYLIGASKKISVVPDPLYYYLKRDDSIMQRAYSVKRLDAVEAVLDRTEYALECGNFDFAAWALACAAHIMSVGYKNQNGNGKVRKRLGLLKKEYNKYYLRVKKGNISSMKWRMLIGLFYLSPQLYIICKKNKVIKAILKK